MIFNFVSIFDKNIKEKIFDNIWVQPAAGDAGGSLGAALAYWHIDLDKARTEINKDNMQNACKKVI